MDNNLVEKIQKLLKLGESSNQHEAESAMKKAQALMLKHNIELSTVECHDSEYGYEEINGINRSGCEDKYINDLLQKFFFITIVRSTREKKITIVGEKNNIKTAIEIRGFLKLTFKQLFTEQSKTLKVNRNSFYYGLWQGLTEKLELQRMETEKKYDMVLVNDPKVEEKVRELFPRTSQTKARIQTDETSRVSGYEKGKNIDFNRKIGA